MKMQKQWITGVILMIALIGCFTAPLSRAMVTTTWNYPIKTNGWITYRQISDFNQTLFDDSILKYSFENCKQVNTTQFFINFTSFSNTTLSPRPDITTDWIYASNQYMWVNNTLSSPIIWFIVMLPSDVTISMAFTPEDLETVQATMLVGSLYHSLNVGVEGKNVTFAVNYTLDMGGGNTRVWNITTSYLYTEFNILNYSYAVTNISDYSGATLTSFSCNKGTYSLINYSQGPLIVLAYPLEWVIGAVTITMVFLLERKLHRRKARKNQETIGVQLQS